MMTQELEQRIENMEADIRDMKAMLAELVEVARGTGQPPHEEHISHSFRHEIEAGQVNPSLGTLYSIAKAFNMTLAELLHGI